ncbi:hypothetical protein RIF29_20863 [Crotalaria pallida]|uniref:Uncharacterized protein n=1 Tax=Crotalaria pallida TaxID=3830 RepID=A0AAN9F1W6_CROPI
MPHLHRQPPFFRDKRVRAPPWMTPLSPPSPVPKPDGFFTTIKALDQYNFDAEEPLGGTTYDSNLQKMGQPQNRGAFDNVHHPHAPVLQGAISPDVMPWLGHATFRTRILHSHMHPRHFTVLPFHC